MILDRRKFLMAALAVAAMPTIVRAESLMRLPVRPRRMVALECLSKDVYRRQIWVTGFDQYGKRMIERIAYVDLIEHPITSHRLCREIRSIIIG
jgi:hypothetical protein